MADKEDKKYFDVAPPKSGSATSIKLQNRSIIGKDDAAKPAASPAPEIDTPSGEMLTPTSEADKEVRISHTGVKIAPHTTTTKADDEKSKEEKVDATEDADVDEIKPAPGAPQVDPLPLDIKNDLDFVNENTEEPSKEESSTDDEKSTDDYIEQPTIDKAEPDKPKDEVMEAKDELEPAVSNEPEEKELSDTSESKDPEESSKTDESSAPNTPAPASLSAIDALPDPGEKVAKEAKEEMQDPKIYDTKEYYVPIGKTHHRHGAAKMAFLFGVICAVALLAVAAYYYLCVMGK